MKVAAGLAGNGLLAAAPRNPPQLAGLARSRVLGPGVAAPSPAALHASVPPAAVPATRAMIGLVFTGLAPNLRASIFRGPERCPEKPARRQPISDPTEAR
jgi:hypothetical protein